MFSYIRRELQLRNIEVSQKAKEAAYYGFWILGTFSPDKGWGRASAVLVRNNIALTSAHNFNEAIATSSKLVSPRTGETLEIKSAELDTEKDIATLILKGKTKENPVLIEKSVPVEKGLPVFKARMTSFDPKIGRLELIRGILKNPVTEVIRRNESTFEKSLCSLFHMHSKFGDSGAGIFTVDGKLLTLNNTGNPAKKEASGTVISEFRKLKF